jgi:hypothetical protein
MTTTFASSHSYQVVDDSTVSLSVTIGNAAVGSTLVLISGNHLVAGTGVNNFPLGPGKTLKGQLMTIASAEVATQNFTSNTVDLSGGTSPQSWTDQHAASPGDNVIYACTVLFV